MNFDGNFRRIGRVDIGPMKALIARLPADAWDAESMRQQRYEVHRDTQTINLVHDPDFRHTNTTRHPAMQFFEPALRPVLDVAARYFDRSPKGRQLTTRHGLGYFVRANLVRLRPGGAIAEHQDKNFSLAHSHRVHVPVVTNDKVRFTVGSETIHMAEGAVFEINNRRMHSVRNDGDTGRVHLILDYVLTGEKCCCGEKLHPQRPCSPETCLATDRMQIPCTCYAESAPAV
jgi:hypothetical protein